MHGKPILSVALAILIVGCMLVSTPSSEGASRKSREVEVGTFMYLWYGHNSTSGNWTGGWGTSHWTASDGIIDKPPIDYYSSIDNDTLGWQLSQMHGFGVSFVIVSWWGPNNYVNEANLNLFRYINATSDSMKVALMVEPYHSELCRSTQLR
jgi:hypothetical protein